MPFEDKRATPFGDEAQFHEAFASLLPRLISYARRYGSAFPEDIAQEAFIILLQRPNPIDYPTSFLYGTVRTLALTERRPMKNRNISIEAVLEPSEESEAESRLIHREVRECMKTLAPNFREALWLFVVDGLSILEISEILQIPKATVKTRIYRAKAELRQQINEVKSPAYA
jgi:RNA polymerase sigma-70 factor (ECF subfamily)